MGNNEPTPPDEGASVGRDVSTGGGDFVGRDKTVSGDGSLVAGRDINIHVHHQSEAGFKPVFLIPPRPGLVIGREEHLQELKTRLGVLHENDRSTSLQVLTAMRGWPGVGKTTLAAMLAHDRETVKAFPDGILWISLGPDAAPTLLSKLSEWGRALGSSALSEARDVQEAHNFLASLLHDRRMLLLIDDAWQVEQARPFMAGGARCATLVTTRQSEIASGLSATPEQIYFLPVLSDEKALELLEKLTPSIVKTYPAEALALVQALEGLPLAIQVAGRLLQAEISRGFGVRDLIKGIQDGAVLLQAKVPADRVDLVRETTPTVAALLLTSLDKLDDFTRDCYGYLGVFAPKPATFDLAAMQFVWNVDDSRPVVSTLVDRGLLEFIPEIERYQMHALLVMLAKTLLTD